MILFTDAPIVLGQRRDIATAQRRLGGSHVPTAAQLFPSARMVPVPYLLPDLADVLMIPGTEIFRVVRCVFSEISLIWHYFKKSRFVNLIQN